MLRGLFFFGEIVYTTSVLKTLLGSRDEEEAFLSPEI